MSEQRIERWIVREPNGFEWVENTRADALKLKDPDDVIIRLVEIRDGEPHPDDVGMMLADAKLRSDAAIERAEKAEAALQGAEFAHEAASKNAKGWHDRALSAESQLNDAAAKFERWAAVRLWAADISHAPGAPMSRAIKSAADLRSHYFPPAKEV